MKRAAAAIAAFLVVCAAWGEDVVIAIGVQPPLFNPAGGIVDSVVARALSLGGLPNTYRWLPIGRMLTELQADRLEVYVTPSNTPGQQNPHVLVLQARGVFFYKKSRFPADPIVKPGDLAGKRVATVINSPLRPMLEAAGAVVDEGPFETMFAKLDVGRVDLVATADVGGILSIRKEFPGRASEFSFTEYSYSNIGAGLYVKNMRDPNGILSAFRNGLAKMKADGSLRKMLIDFFGEESWRRVRILE
jgi:ABC-type amino acid transport substrate-binding protein